ncbi:hypothetical protein BH11PLA2_BH11PLA2_27120 [soil metagenome]
MKLRRTLALMVAMAGLTSTMTMVMAQDTKPKPKTPADDKKAAPKVEDKKAPAKAGSGSIEIYEGKSGWRFRIKNAEDKTIAMPTKGHEKKEDMLKDLEMIKKILADEKPKEVKE